MKKRNILTVVISLAMVICMMATVAQAATPNARNNPMNDPAYAGNIAIGGGRNQPGDGAGVNIVNGEPPALDPIPVASSVVGDDNTTGSSWWNEKMSPVEGLIVIGLGLVGVVLAVMSLVHTGKSRKDDDFIGRY